MSEYAGASPVTGVRREGNAVVVKVEGDIDLERSLAFQQELLRLLDEKPQRVIIDLSGVPYMDSSGVASLVKLLSRTRKQGVELVLVAPSERVRSVFEITRLDSVFEIKPSVAEALG